MYPSDELLAAARSRGIPLVISSDAHEAAHVGRFWDEAIGKARRAGFRETLRLSDRRLVPLPAGRAG
jgi:histidinol-phosphatase (PHP family)